jgi:indolepyruvate ferredoxin oxidoreductase alpha subunit
MLQVRIRCCHVHGHFIAKDNKRPPMTVADALDAPRRDTGRIVLPPASFLHEKEKLGKRWPAAVDYVKKHALNEYFGPAEGEVGIILLGGMYNGVMRALQQLGLADVYGNCSVPLYVLNVAYPLIDDQLAEFCAGKKAVLMGSGGSIPFIADLVERYPSAQILITGVEDPDARAHSPNESLHLPTFQHAILSEALLLARLNARE